MKKIKLGVSVGDLNGVGIEIILKTFKDIRILDFCTPIIFCSNKIISKYRSLTRTQDININFNIINSMKDINYKKCNILNISKEDTEIKLGMPTSFSGEYAYTSLKKSIQELKNNTINALVTAPINKNSIKINNPDFIGHTELLEKEFKGDALMIMTSDVMKIACVTGHMPLSDIPKNINVNTIINKTKILNQSLMSDFGIIKPKIAILGINPHAGENGAIGKEEEEIIIPAIDKLKKENIICYGPYPADSFFTDKNLQFFDGILAMFHDQALIPFKTISFSNGVNFTAGLNIVRTSPAHGTAHDIAGKGMADENSFRQAVYVACDAYKKRILYTELHAAND